MRDRNRTGIDVPSHNTVPIPDGYVVAPLSDPFEQFMGPVFCEPAPDGSPRLDGRMAFRVAEHHMNAGDVCHGGMLTTFADAVLGAHAWSACRPKNCVTLSMQTQFIRPARIGDLVECTPELTRATRAVLFVRGAAHVGDALIFTATSVWKIIGEA